jgi:hypothetical protein
MHTTLISPSSFPPHADHIWRGALARPPSFLSHAALPLYSPRGGARWRLPSRSPAASLPSYQHLLPSSSPLKSTPTTLLLHTTELNLPHPPFNRALLLRGDAGRLRQEHGVSRLGGQRRGGGSEIDEQRLPVVANSSSPRCAPPSVPAPGCVSC